MTAAPIISTDKIHNHGTGTSSLTEKRQRLLFTLPQESCTARREKKAILAFGPPAPFPEKEAYRYPIQAQSFPKLILKVSLIGEMNSLREIGNHDKGGWRRVNLGRVIELQSPTLIHRRFVMKCCRFQEPVQGRGGKALMELTIHLADFREDPLDAVACFGRNPKDRGKGDEVGGQAHLFQQPVLFLFIVLNQIPFINEDHQARP